MPVAFSASQSSVLPLRCVAQTRYATLIRSPPTWQRVALRHGADRRRSRRPSQEAAVAQRALERLDSVLESPVARQAQVRGGRRLVGIVHAGEAGDLAGARLRVQALGVAPLADL